MMKLRPSLHEGPGSIDHGSKIGGFSPIIRLNKSNNNNNNNNNSFSKIGPKFV
jgi:hypothetical protein